jgi:glycosyltransferase involved in cell wall biosynthesis
MPSPRNNWDEGRKMALKKMLMITSHYPYGQGEAFVASELEPLAHCFEHIELVPIFHDPGEAARPTRQPINLAYAEKRWGMLRALHVARALLQGLAKYRWAADLGFILRHGRKLDNLKELARAIYRARLFESFLASRARKGEVFDVIYFYWLLPEIMGAVQFRESIGGSMRIVCRAHGGDLYEDRKPGGYAGLRRSIVAGVDDIYCISSHGQRYLVDCFPELAAKFHVARLGVDDPGHLNPQPSGGALEIVSCSFAVPGKRLHLIADAIACLLSAAPTMKVRWTHVGDGPLFDEVRAYARARLGERAQVVFKGYLTPDELRALYREEPFDVIVNVSDSEGIPVSLIEASSVGIPMVATDVGGSAEIVNAANGALIPADADVATIAAAIRRFSDRAAARAYRRAARAWWEAHFNAATNHSQFGRNLADPGAASCVETPGTAAASARPAGSAILSRIENPCTKLHDGD